MQFVMLLLQSGGDGRQVSGPLLTKKPLFTALKKVALVLLLLQEQSCVFPYHHEGSTCVSLTVNRKSATQTSP